MTLLSPSVKGRSGMSRIDDLIAELCPDGVAHYRLCEVARILSGLKGKTKNDFLEGNRRYISYKNVFSNPSVDLTWPDYVRINEGENQTALEKGDVLVTSSSETLEELGTASVVECDVDEPLYLNSFCFVVRFDPQVELCPSYLKHIFRSEPLRIQIQRCGNGVTRINVSKHRFLDIRIPVPPLEIQQEIVRVLDRFTQLEAELEAELEARKRQYAHYREQLLIGESASDWVPLRELGQFIRGRRFTKRDMVSSGTPCIHYGEIYTHYGVSAVKALSHVRDDIAGQLRYAQPGDVVIAGVGETVSDVGKSVAWLGDDPVAIHDDTFCFRSEQDPSYISYVIQTDAFQEQKNRHVARAKVKRIGSDGLGRIMIPVPPLEEQRRIASILDKFDALVNDLTVGLPAEIAARRKQYEYYRDRLLTFEEKR